MDRYGKSVLAYRFFHRGRLLFAGADFHCSPLHAVDADATVAGVLAFLSLKPGDTDPEYFEGYTPGRRARTWPCTSRSWSGGRAGPCPGGARSRAEGDGRSAANQVGGAAPKLS